MRINNAILKKLCKTFHEYSELTHLDLSDNDFTSYKPIARLLEHNNQINVVKLQGNYMDGKAALDIWHGLNKNFSVEELILETNENVHDETKSMIELEVDRNKIIQNRLSNNKRQKDNKLVTIMQTEFKVVSGNQHSHSLACARMDIIDLSG